VAVIVVLLVLLLVLLLLLWFGGGGGGGGGGWGPRGPEGPDDGVAATPERERSDVQRAALASPGEREAAHPVSRAAKASRPPS
jgi:hypothetical protein